MQQSVRVSLSGRIHRSEYSADQVSAAEFTIDIERGEDVIEAVFAESLAQVLRQVRSELSHRDAVVRLEAAANARTVPEARASEDLPDEDEPF